MKQHHVSNSFQRILKYKQMQSLLPISPHQSFRKTQASQQEVLFKIVLLDHVAVLVTVINIQHCSIISFQNKLFTSKI